MRSAVTAAQKEFTQKHCHVSIELHISRLCGHTSYNIMTEQLTCCAHCERQDSMSLFSWEMSGDDSPKCPAPSVDLPLSQQVIAITGNWFGGLDGQLGHVAGDRVIDMPKLDQDFCTWQSWDADLWKYAPYTCEIVTNPVWYYS